MPNKYKPSAGDLNEKAGGDQEMENRKYMREQEMKARRDAITRKEGLSPDADYYREMRNVRPESNRRIARNDKDLAAQSRIDALMTGFGPKTRGGGPAQQDRLNDDRAANRGRNMYAKGGMVRGDGCCQRGKTKGTMR